MFLYAIDRSNRLRDPTVNHEGNSYYAIRSQSPGLESLQCLLFAEHKHMMRKLQEPRLAKISVHMLRHWKAIMEYHNTKDLLHVMAFLGHRKSDTSFMYIQLDQKLFKQSGRSLHNQDSPQRRRSRNPCRGRLRVRHSRIR